MTFVKVVCCYVGNRQLFVIPKLSNNINSKLKVETINFSNIPCRIKNFVINEMKTIMLFHDFLLLKHSKIIYGSQRKICCWLVIFLYNPMYNHYYNGKTHDFHTHIPKIDHSELSKLCHHSPFDILLIFSHLTDLNLSTPLM